MVAVSGALVYVFWEPSIQGVQAWLSEFALMDSMMRWLGSVGADNLRSVVAPLLVLMLMLPLIIILSLLAVAWLVTPAIVALVSERRFAQLARRHGGSFWRGMLFSVSTSLLAIVALLLSMPLWLIPPLIMVLPPLVWGWLTYRVMGYDVLAEHASRDERIELIRRHRGWMLAMGVFTGYLGAAPGMVWAIGAMAIVMAPLLVPLAIWIYTFVFVFSALWFAHYCLGALEALRNEATMAPAPSSVETSPVTVASSLASDSENPALPNDTSNASQPPA
jgi:hypothetical protein